MYKRQTLYNSCKFVDNRSFCENVIAEGNQSWYCEHIQASHLQQFEYYRDSMDRIVQNFSMIVKM